MLQCPISLGELVHISVPSSWMLANADDILSATNIQVDNYIPDTFAVASLCTTSECICEARQ